MSKLEFLKFGDAETEKQEYHSSKSAISIYDVNIDKIIISEEFFYAKRGSKYFVGYKDIKEITPLYVLLPKSEWIFRKI